MPEREPIIGDSSRSEEIVVPDIISYDLRSLMYLAPVRGIVLDEGRKARLESSRNEHDDWYQRMVETPSDQLYS